MPLLAVLDEGAHGALDESLKPLYVQNTETKQFYLDIAPDEAAKVAFNLQKQFDAKKADLQRVHGEKTAIEQKYKAYEGLGKTADEIKQALAANRPEEVTKLVEKYETEKAELRKSFEEPLTKATERAKKLESQFQQTLASSEISKVVAAYQLDPETAPSILRDYIRAVPKEEGSDEYVTQVYENGQPALVAGQPMSTEQLIKGWQEGKKFQGMFLAGREGGTGGSNRQVQSFGGKTFTVSREASKTNPQLYQSAKAEAEKVGGQVAWTD